VKHLVISVVLSMAGVLGAADALADIPGPDACQEADVGKACDNATNADGKMSQPGTCQKATCTRATPSGSMSYDCFACKATPTAAKDDGKCSLSVPTHSSALAAAPFALGLLLWSRRRRAARTK
jgi:hypothetical protein